ncbi:GNAT family N-acetyltransferase [Sedimentitalea todarodis]|uniref:N-acetyltransferase family protein n=1 Tax=Sedimentitalea todarodis TaxID=1631240 RepID=A0ABU3VJH2_9RHOB|nr:N-acetyltransferase family protein [Sedimentitalea todarodis]MDU9006301.1 N-acetyltransferase family protein [Sedimentitalea todarodis]
MIVRQAKEEDAAAICNILNPIIRHSSITFTTVERTLESVSQNIRTRGPAFQVMEAHDEVAGFATYGPFRPGPGYARTAEHSIHLAPDRQGVGLGRMLMERLEQVAAAEGVHVLIAAISSSNPAAVAFHEAIGFHAVGRLPEVGFKAGAYLDLVLMQKILTPRPDSAPDTSLQPG